MFEIKFTEEAIDDLQWFKKVERSYVIGELETVISVEPTTETRNRQENELVNIAAVGYKEGSQLFIGGKEYKL